MATSLSGPARLLPLFELDAHGGATCLLGASKAHLECWFGDEAGAGKVV
jgi:hypothetical protein